MRRWRTFILALILAALLGGFFVPAPALAQNAEAVFDISGGTAEQRAAVLEALEASTWDWPAFGGESTKIELTASHPPYWGSGNLSAAGGLGDELAFPLEGQHQVYWGVAYYPSGDIYINAAVTDPALLREIAVHEAAHARVMFVWFWDRPGQVYDCPALQAWRELIGAEGDLSDWWRDPVESHAEWFRVTYLDTALQYHQTPRTYLPGPPRGTADVRDFHDTWCPSPEERPVPITWVDIPTDDDELMRASRWAYNEGIWQGYPDATFHPWDPVLKRHVALVAERLQLPAPYWHNVYVVATRGQVAAAIPGLEWLEERWDEPLTRSQLLRLMYRSRDGLDADTLMADKLDRWFTETRYTWQGVTRQPRITGQGALIAQQAREHDVPIWLCLGMGWYESCWCTTGLAITYNCGWGMKDAFGRWGEVRGMVQGFADYTSVEEMIRAYFLLMDSDLYRAYIDTENWDALLERYAPSYENDHQAHVATVMTVRRWCEERGIR